MKQHNPVGRHLLLTLHGCPSHLLDDAKGLTEVLRHAARASGATILEVVVHQFTPHGVTVLALLGESHASLHTYPEHGLAYIDCFTCGEHCDPTQIVPILVGALQPQEVDQQLVERAADVPI